MMTAASQNLHGKVSAQSWAVLVQQLLLLMAGMAGSQSQGRIDLFVPIVPVCRQVEVGVAPLLAEWAPMLQREGDAVVRPGSHMWKVGERSLP